MGRARLSDLQGMTQVARHSWIRRPSRNVGFACGYALAGAWLLVMLAAALSELANRGGNIWVGLTVVLAGLAALAVRLLVGWARAGLLVTTDEVVVRGPWATRRIALTFADRFEAGLQHTAVGNPTPGVVLRLRDGSAVNVAALATESMVWSCASKVDRWEPVAKRLNDLLTKPRK
jgi:hypothetical protein